MSAYIIVDIEVTDPEKYAEYIKVVPATLAAYGGKYLVRGGPAEKLEGDWDPNRVVVVEFESFERAKQWWTSDDYRTPKEIRRSASISKIVLVDGIE